MGHKKQDITTPADLELVDGDEIKRLVVDPETGEGFLVSIRGVRPAPRPLRSPAKQSNKSREICYDKPKTKFAILKTSFLLFFYIILAAILLVMSLYVLGVV